MQRSLIILYFIVSSVSLYARRYVPFENYDKNEIVKVDVRKLHPTQFAVGEKLVDEKKVEIRELLDNEDKAGLKEIACEAVIGPSGRLYLVEGHHRAKAYYEMKHYDVYVKITKDWSDKTESEFWDAMENKEGLRKTTRVYLTDEKGKKRNSKELPKTVAGLKNNPYRSIVNDLVNAEVIEKNEDRFPVYGEFIIADWLRTRVNLVSPLTNKAMFKATIASALLLTKKENQSANLPGQKSMSKTECLSLLKNIE